MIYSGDLGHCDINTFRDVSSTHHQGQSTDKVKQVIADNFKAIGQEMQAGDAAINSLVITLPV